MVSYVVVDLEQVHDCLVELWRLSLLPFATTISVLGHDDCTLPQFQCNMLRWEFNSSPQVVYAVA